jgi:putative ABC transport system substrate-binding protein
MGVCESVRHLAGLAIAGILVLFSLGALVSCDEVALEPTAAPLTIGLVTNNPNGLRNVQGFRDGLAELGYAEGERVRYLFTGKPTPRSELRSHIEQMIRDGASMVFTAGTPTGVAAHEATREQNVPIVFGVIADPLAAGVMSDLAQPGGNMTGVMLSQNQARRLQLLQLLSPSIRTVWIPFNPDDAAPRSAVAQVEAVAADLGLRLVKAPARNQDEVTAALADIGDEVDAVFMVPDSTFNRRLGDLLDAAAARRLPVSGPSLVQAEGGALMSYGIVHHEVGVQAARIADMVLRGADPGALPVQTAEFHLVINVAAAERIGLDIPEELLYQADMVLREDRYGR